MMLSLREVEKSFGGRVIFQRAQMQLNQGERVAVVGPNGSGKTTLLRLLAGEESPDAGEISLPSRLKIGYLKQDVTETSALTVLEEVLSASPGLCELERRLAFLEDEVSARPGDRSLLEEYGKLRDEFEALGGPQRELKARKILSGLGFKRDEHEKPIRTFSGGWMMRVSLAKLLYREPELLLLDEPTNHLDLDSLLFLEEYLLNYPGALLFVSHDRIFLDRLAQRIIEIRENRLQSYTGNYNSYLEKKEREGEELEKRLEIEKRYVEKSTRFIERFRYKAKKASQVQSRIKSLEKMEQVELPKENRKDLHLQFTPSRRSNLIVARLDRVSKSYGENEIYADLDLTIYRGQRIALVGPNGAGKSTLLKILAQVEPIQSGRVTIGGNVSTAYYAQHQLDLLHREHNVLEEISEAAPDLLPQEVRRIAGIFLFPGDDALKPISVLSGGERARVALARMLARPANFLIMDEPTNHLDIQAREVLENALSSYDGTLIFVSHDRHFMNSLATQVWEVQDKKIKQYEGNYDYYAWKKDQKIQKENEREDSPTPRTNALLNQKELRQKRAREIQARSRALRPLLEESGRLEREITALEEEQKALTDEVCKVEIQSNPILYPEKLKQLKKTEEELEVKLERWATVSDELKRLENKKT